MDKLDKIFEMQNELNQRIAKDRNLNYTKEEWIQKNILAMLSELSELLDEVNFKWWKNPKEISDLRIKEELVDILHFFVSMCLKAGMSADELAKLYIEKNQENHARQDGTSQKKGYEV